MERQQVASTILQSERKIPKNGTLSFFLKQKQLKKSPRNELIGMPLRIPMEFSFDPEAAAFCFIFIPSVVSL